MFNSYSSFYKPCVITGVVTDEFTRPLENVVMASESHQTLTDKHGKFQLILGSQDSQIKAETGEFTLYDEKIKDGENQKRIVLIRKNAGLLYRSTVFLYNLLLPFHR